MPFTLRRNSAELVSRTATLQKREWLSPSYVRLRLGVDELHGLRSSGPDDHIRLFFGDSGAGTHAANREFTPVSWNDRDSSVDLEFVVHSGDGVAGSWGGYAPLGSTIGIGGPRGSLAIDGQPDWWFLAGDESALPVIRRFIRAMPPGAIGLVLIEVADPSHELPLTVPAGVSVRWVHRTDMYSSHVQAKPTAALIDALDELWIADRPDGASGFVFIGAEQSVVKPGRALAIDRWGVDESNTLIKGYWKRSEDAIRAPSFALTPPPRQAPFSFES